LDVALTLDGESIYLIVWLKCCWL